MVPGDGDQTPRQIGILLFDGLEELDALGPWEVLSYWCRTHPEDGWAVSCVSRHGGMVDCAKGLRVESHYSFEDAPQWDVLLHPGGQGVRPLLTDAAHLEWVRAQRASVPLMTSVCTGALVYAAAGILSTRPATTHIGNLDLLRQLDPTIEVRSEVRFVDDGDVITAAGVSAGLDMAVHLVSRLAGPARADQVCRALQYEVRPPA
ncbi:MAG: DJ-1/PfpI family protein [Acidimicrobiales bacterium]